MRMWGQSLVAGGEGIPQQWERPSAAVGGCAQAGAQCSSECVCGGERGCPCCMPDGALVT